MTPVQLTKAPSSIQMKILTIKEYSVTTLKNPELLRLASANVNQLTINGLKQEWNVRENITGDNLGSFPSNIDDKTMFKILNFAKKYELEAFNIGINFEKGKSNDVLMDRINRLQGEITSLKAHNGALAQHLEEFTNVTD